MKTAKRKQYEARTKGKPAKTKPVATGPLFHFTDEPHSSGEFITFDRDVPVLHCHPNQHKALKQAEDPAALRVLVLAGWQSGKSQVGPPWMALQMRLRGPGNYLLAAPTFKLLDMQPVRLLQHFLGRVLGLGAVVGGAMGEFRVSAAGHARLWAGTSHAHIPYDPDAPTRIKFGHAANPDSLASITAKAAWLDEPGQAGFKAESYEEVRGRLGTTTGPMLLTTRPYVHHWLKDEVYERADRNRRGKGTAADAGFVVVQFSSIDNPKFSRQEYEQARTTMPPWRFSMKYDGMFTKPAGAVYDCFDEAVHVRPGGAAYRVPARWPVKVGLDFGAPNFAAVFAAEETIVPEGVDRRGRPMRPTATGNYVVFAEYRPTESCTAADHVTAMKEVIERYTGVARVPDFCAGGSGSEGQWRDELAAAGWPVSPPNQTDVEVGIERVYEGFASRRLTILDSCPKLIAEIKAYSRKVDDAGEVMNELEDKATFHGADSLRYLCNYLMAPAPQFRVIGL